MDKKNNMFINKTMTIVVKPQEPKLSGVVFVRDKTHFFINLLGRGTNFLFLALQELEWNSNVISFEGNVKINMCNKLDISGANFSNCLGLLCANGIFSKIKNNVYEYNPHLFFYGDEHVVNKWRERWDCEFDDETCKIKVRMIRKNK